MSWGTNIKITIFGESHGAGIGGVIEGLKPGLAIDFEHIDAQMARRAPGSSRLVTPRAESDKYEILGGVYEGRITGAPLAFAIRNTNTRSSDYDALKQAPRPGHADFTGHIRYSGFNDPRGGGHFSGRLTAPLVFAGALAAQYLERDGIYTIAHIKQLGGLSGDSLSHYDKELAAHLKRRRLPTLSPALEEQMGARIRQAHEDKDSVGGVIECAIVNLPAGLGNPFFNSVESVLTHLIFSVPAVKGIEFGAGFGFANMRGSTANDPFCMDGDTVRTKTNHNGGLNGGITNGMPVIFRTVIKPTPSIARAQETVDLDSSTNTSISIVGRHDPCILPRALPVIESCACLAALDFMAQ